jgi:hypothetical protein
MEARVSAAIAPDEHRIAVQGVLLGVYDAAVDLAARREMLAGRFKARMAARRFDEAEQTLKELRQLPTAEDLVASRTAELKKGLSVDAASQGKIDAALADFQKALRSHFDARSIDELAKQLEKRKGTPAKSNH